MLTLRRCGADDGLRGPVLDQRIVRDDPRRLYRGPRGQAGEEHDDLDRDALERLWILIRSAWLPTRNRIARRRCRPSTSLPIPRSRRDFGVDTNSLFLDGVSARRPADSTDGPLFGALFQSVVRSRHAYAQAAEASVKHLRTASGAHEVELIVERADGRMSRSRQSLPAIRPIAPCATSTGSPSRSEADLLDRGVVTTGPYAYRRPDGIAVVPAALLGP